jgi:hypothetical protein
VGARFRRLAARAEGCPWSGVAGVLSVEPCAFFEVGSLYGEGTAGPRVAHEGGGTSPWLAPGVLGRLVTRLDWLAIVVEVSSRFPLQHERFGVVTAGDAAPFYVYETPAVAFGGALGLGIRL